MTVMYRMQVMQENLRSGYYTFSSDIAFTQVKCTTGGQYMHFTVDNLQLVHTGRCCPKLISQWNQLTYQTVSAAH